MMNELLQMNNEGALNADQMYWFRNTKTPEEFYLRDKDPNNLDNQINNEKHHSSVDEMREALESWIGQVGDKGVVSEYDMFMEMWPNGSQPTTAEPRVIRSENVVELQSDNPAASLAYILCSEKIAPDLNAGWKIYHKPIPIQSSNYLYAMSTRIGYKDSEIIEVILTEY